jgi:hypothetical protein
MRQAIFILIDSLHKITGIRLTNHNQSNLHLLTFTGLERLSYKKNTYLCH